MKLLFDHNLSPSLVDRLSDVFPASRHVFNLGLHEKADSALWMFAKDRSGLIENRRSRHSSLNAK